jgi:hypothetical protein
MTCGKNGMHISGTENLERWSASCADERGAKQGAWSLFQVMLCYPWNTHAYHGAVSALQFFSGLPLIASSAQDWNQEYHFPLPDRQLATPSCSPRAARLSRSIEAEDHRVRLRFLTEKRTRTAFAGFACKQKYAVPPFLPKDFLRSRIYSLGW